MPLSDPSQTTEELKNAVWAKGREIPNYDAVEWRWDHNGGILRYADYGNKESQYGWEIDYITPAESGGSDKIDNLRPLRYPKPVVAENTAAAKK